MSGNKFVLNADDFGMSSAYNKAVLEACPYGLLRSVSLVPNGEAFDEAVDKIIPSCPELGIGVHLNIIEGKALSSELDQLTDANGTFNKAFSQILLKSYNRKDKSFLEQVEKEFRAQIEKVRSKKIEITHLDSHVHIHSIPPIFEITAKLAKEYEIKQIRTQFERPYIVPDVFIHLNAKYPINLVKIALLNFFTLINRKTVKKYELKTNDYITGVGYTSMMTSLTVSYGISALKNKSDITLETLIHPCRYEDGTIDNHFVEYQITRNDKLKNKIEELGFEICNYT